MSDRASSSTHWPALLLLATAIFGPPSAAVLAFTHAVTQNPWLTALLIGIYEILVFLITILGKIWQKLEDPWIEQIAGWIALRMQWTISGAYRTYYQCLLYQHRDIDVKGLSTQNVYTLALSQVFVNLNMVPTPAHQTSTDPLQVPKSLLEGEHPIWDYLVSPSLAGQHFAILGAPGSGKTTLLKHMVLTLLGIHKSPRAYKVPRKLPMLIFLREHAAQIKADKDFSLETAIHDHIKKWCKQTLPAGWIKQRLTSGRFLIFLDGLDEVANLDARKQVVDWLQQQMIAYGKNRFVITSRPFGYKSYPLSGVTVLEVHSFNSKQIENFVNKWYLANEIMSSRKNDAGVQMKAASGADDLLRRLHRSPALFALAVNPLLLTMIATVHRYRDTLPGKRVTLYTEICEVFLGKRQEAKGLTLELTAAQQKQVLQPLAYYMMCEGVRELSRTSACYVIAEPLSQVSATLRPETFLTLVENASGLLLEREVGSYSFAHLTFQEYLAAVHIKETGLEQNLVSHIADTWWHETIRLYCAQADATILLEVCLKEERPSLAILTLAFECLEEALRVQPFVRAKLEKIIEQEIEDADIERRNLIAETLLTLRLKRMAHLSEKVDVDTSFVTCAEYQLFLNDTSGASHLPIHWQGGVFPSGEGNAPVLGVKSIDAQAFCDWLTQHSPGPWKYDLPTKGNQDVIERDNNTDTAASFMGEVGYWCKGKREFTWVGNISSIAEKVKSAIQSSLSTILRYDLDCLQPFIRDHAIVLPAKLALNQFLGTLPMATSEDFVKSDAHYFDRELAHVFANDLSRAYERMYLETHRTQINLAGSGLPSSTYSYYSSVDFLPKLLSNASEILLKGVSPFHVYPSFTSPNLLISITATNELVQMLVPSSNAILQYAIDLTCILGLDQSCVFDLVSLLNFIEESQAKTLHSSIENLRLKRLAASCYTIRLRAQMLALFVHFQILRKRPKNTQKFEPTIKHFLNVYMIFALLEARIRGKFPVWEGILLTRTHIED